LTLTNHFLLYRILTTTATEKATLYYYFFNVFLYEIGKEREKMSFAGGQREKRRIVRKKGEKLRRKNILKTHSAVC